MIPKMMQTGNFSRAINFGFVPVHMRINKRKSFALSHAVVILLIFRFIHSKGSVAKWAQNTMHLSLHPIHHLKNDLPSLCATSLSSFCQPTHLIDKIHLLFFLFKAIIPHWSHNWKDKDKVQEKIFIPYCATVVQMLTSFAKKSKSHVCVM